ncbi:hypothetical protein BGZ81_000850 [Podila clonocystis]|nr:hypothetical protein BGZ81_000850 [Podila clonocystis]
MPTTVESSLLDAIPLGDGSTVIQNSESGYLQVSPLFVNHFQETPSSLSSSFGTNMLAQTAYPHSPLVTDYNTMFSDHATECPQVPTLIAGAPAIRTTSRTIKPSGSRPTAKLPCPFAGCDYRYNLKRELNRHKNIHLFEDKDKYQCLHCNAGLCRLDSVKRHMEAKGKSACLDYGLYREFKPNGEVKRVRKCKDNWYAAAVAARMKGK